jgi:predicted SAM-dependent methyltransferase
VSLENDWMKAEILQRVFELAKEVERAARSIGRRKEAIRRLASYHPPYKLHLGCGSIHLDRWINVDWDHSLQSVDIVWDLAYGIPVPDASCRIIYCEHFLEHLPVEQGVAFLRECRRVLGQAGVLRVAMPSLDVLLSRCHDGSWRDQDWLNWPEYRFVKTQAEMLNIAFRWWGHQWLYDREELHRRLREAAFNQVRNVEWGESEIPELRNIESRRDSLLICEATVS